MNTGNLVNRFQVNFLSWAGEGGAQREKKATQGPNKLFPSHPSPRESQEAA